MLIFMQKCPSRVLLLMEVKIQEILPVKMTVLYQMEYHRILIKTVILRGILADRNLPL
jgi:hypothetical protein